MSNKLLSFRRNTVSLFTLITVLILSLLTGCGTTPANPPANMDKAQSSETAVHTTYPFKITDDFKAEVTIPAEPKRIVSLVPASTETLYALGLGDNVVGVTKYDDYPKEALQKAEYVFEDSLKPNTEQILKLNPDLIIVGLQDEKTITAIRNLKIPVVQFNPQTLNSTYDTLLKFGQITNKQAEAQKLVNAMQQKEKSIEQKVAGIKDADRLKVWIEVDPNLFTAGEGTFLNELLLKAGGKNIASDVKDWAQYSTEQVIAKNPQVIFDTYSYYLPNVKETIFARPSWQNLDAIKNKRVVDLDSDMVTRPGPRIVDGMESIAKALYPDVFK
ncbi:ABC transporter substrate-binding protein [Desulfitobacterium sp.]|uniref:ABC transporter substrate-binding protein n=1 Tax=Desulfitobacterium sp. TaxID=49981 RepID=UPI002B731B6E|nr:ABC transporter substrate-binding protein [Desulfitobacterium sp.]HVJ50041.1 ABC transporter substrate-binding protein [Desulfitobacterium sp.]